jgi:hypothetical protein
MKHLLHCLLSIIALSQGWSVLYGKKIQRPHPLGEAPTNLKTLNPNFNFHSNSSRILLSQCNSCVNLGPKSHDPMSKAR